MRMCFNDFDVAIVMVEEDIPARAYGRLIYIENTKDEHDSNSEARQR